MGIDYVTAHYCKTLRVDWDQVLQVGRQNWWLTARESGRLGLAWRPRYSRQLYSEPFFWELGARVVESVDRVGNEGPTFRHDLSTPWDQRERWSVVVDFGTGEHVANQEQYWRNLHAALRLNGHLVVVVPMNQLAGHGLLQFSPEFFWRMGGFGHQDVRVVQYGWSVRSTPWSPTGRFQLKTRWPTYCFATLKKVGSFALPLQDATTTHRRAWRATWLLDWPLVRRIQRVLM